MRTAAGSAQWYLDPQIFRRDGKGLGPFDIARSFVGGEIKSLQDHGERHLERQRTACPCTSACRGPTADTTFRLRPNPRSFPPLGAEFARILPPEFAVLVQAFQQHHDVLRGVDRPSAGQHMSADRTHGVDHHRRPQTHQFLYRVVQIFHFRDRFIGGRLAKVRPGNGNDLVPQLGICLFALCEVRLRPKLKTPFVVS